MPTLRLRLVAPLLFAASMLGAVEARAMLVNVFSQASVQTAGPGVPNNVVRDPALVTVTAGTSFGEAGLSPGTFLARAEWLPSYTDGVVQTAIAGADVNLQNMDVVPIAIGPVTLIYDASFLQTLDADSGSFSHVLDSILSVSKPGNLISARASYSYAGRRTPDGSYSERLFTLPLVGGTGISTILTATPSLLMGELTAPGFVLDPGEIVRITYSLDARAFGSEGWGALTDASQTARLHMQIPAGVMVDSRVPLNWITTVSSVPEPGTIALAGLGIGAMAWMRRKQARRNG